MFLNVDLIKELFNRIGDKAPNKDDMRLMLLELGIDRKEASEESKLNQIRKLYIQALPYISKGKMEIELKKSIETEAEEKEDKSEDVIEVSKNMILLKSGDEISIQVPRNDTNIDHLINFLKTMKKQTEDRKK